MPNKEDKFAAAMKQLTFNFSEHKHGYQKVDVNFNPLMTQS